MAPIDAITVIIKTFEKPRTIKGSIRRIRRFYPRIRILVADDSAAPLQLDDDRTVLYRLPFDTGISAGRNHLLAAVETPYCLQIDDDHYFTRNTRLDRMVESLQTRDLDILGGLVLERRRRTLYLTRAAAGFHMNLDLAGQMLKCVTVRLDEREACTRCDVVQNFFLARTDRVRAMGGWDERLKVGEHLEFFLRAKVAGLKVACTTRSSVNHVHLRSERLRPEYARFPQRVHEFRLMWMKWHGITTIVDSNGAVTTAER